MFTNVIVIFLINYSLRIKAPILSAYFTLQVHIGAHFGRVALTTSSQWGVMVTKLNVPTDWKGVSLFLFYACGDNRVHLTPRLTLFPPSLQLQSGRFIYYSWDCFWHQLFYFMCSSRILILSGTSRIHLQDQRLRPSMLMQHLKNNGAALDL